MKMRELEKRTGVNRETIRVYLREGLLPEPSRPARNSADYDERHVRGIQAIRKLQHDTSMTLPRIKAALSGEQDERRVSPLGLSHLEDLVSSRVGVRKGHVSLKALARTNPHASRDAASLADIGVIELINGRGGPFVSVTDAGLIDIWARMRKVGFDEAHGFPPEILSYYREAAELVAGQEAQLFLDQVRGKMGQEEAARMLEFALPAMLDFFGIIRQRIFLRNIRESTAGTSSRPVPRRRKRR